MCNLYSNLTSAEAMRRLFKVAPDRDRLGNAPPLSAIFPRGDAPVVRLDATGARELLTMHWGFLMPQVSKKTGKPILPKAVNNARDDKVRRSGFWRGSFAERRCLIPATAFCEAKGRAPATYTWFGVRDPETEGETRDFAFAGLWRSFRGTYRKDLVEIDTCAMMTSTPNHLVRDVHPDRMPVILAPENYEVWMTGSQENAAALLRPFPAEAMRIVARGEGVKAEPAKEPG